VKREVGVRGVGSSKSGTEWAFHCDDPLCLSMDISHDDRRNQGE
jgi:hypothetical protein